MRHTHATIMLAAGIHATFGTPTPPPTVNTTAEWAGHWVIIGGTGGVADLHGQGTFNGPSSSLLDTGQVHSS